MFVITGGAGFIGSALVWRLNALGLDEIVVVDNLGSSQKWRNLVKRSYVDYIQRDKFREMFASGFLPWKVDGIVHLGACSSTTETDADFLMENNFHYSRDLCRFALDRGINFINASSAATYGAGEHGFSDAEDLVPELRPLNMYGYSKQLFDLWLLREGLTGSVASLKFFNVYGPNEYHKGPMQSVMLKFFRQIGEQGRAVLFASNKPQIADGEQKRDFVYVKDCAILLATLLLERSDARGIHNVGTGCARSYKDVAKCVFAAMGKTPVIEYEQMPAELSRNYQNFTRADMQWLEEKGLSDKFCSIEAGIGDYVGNYLANSDPYL